MALIDTFDCFDPALGHAAGVDLSRLLWIRGWQNTRMATQCIERAIKAAGLVFQAGRFGIVVIDVVDAPVAAIRRLPFTTWRRLARAIEASETVGIVIGSTAMGRSAGGRSIVLGAPQHSIRWSGSSRSRVFQGIDIDAQVASTRYPSRPFRIRITTPDLRPTTSSMFACLYRLPSTRSFNRPDTSNALVHLAREYSPKIEVHGHALVVLDVSGLGQLWGSPREVGQRLRGAAAERDLAVRVAVARTKMAALLATQGRCGLTVIPPGGEAEALSTLPLTVLKQLSHAQASGPTVPARAHRGTQTAKAVSPAPPSSLAVSVLMLLPVVQRWGVKTLGELVALPTDELFSRLGHGGLELQRIARGEDNRPLVPESDEERFEQTMTLEWPVEGLEPLSFVLARVLEPLCTHLEKRGVAVGRLHVQLTLVTRETHERTLEFPASVNDPKLLRTLVVLDLETHPPSAGIDRVTVVADPVPTRTLQFSLLDRAVPSAECLSTLLARLTVLMGDRRCGAPALIDTHHPGAFEMRTFDPKAQRSTSSTRARGTTGLLPALRRFRNPMPARVAVEQDHPVRVSIAQQRSGGQVVSWAGPWRSSGQWWMSPRASWDRNEWDVELSDGGVYRIFRDRVSRRWFVEGMVD